jgi:hypothetical protein
MRETGKTTLEFHSNIQKSRMQLSTKYTLYTPLDARELDEKS